MKFAIIHSRSIFFRDILLFRQDAVAPEFEQMHAVESKKGIQGYCLMLSVPVFILK